MRSTLVKGLIFAAAAAFTTVFFINWCHLVYQCGCTFTWAGGAAHCNIQSAGPPDCPWCADALAGGIAYFFTLGVQAVVAFWRWRAGWKRLLLALAASPVAAAVAGVAIGWWKGYWTT